MSKEGKLNSDVPALSKSESETNDSLRERGYTVTKVIRVMPSGKSYAKTINPMGTHVLVEYGEDLGGSVYVPSAESIFSDEKKEESLNISHEARGVMIECNEGACIIKGDTKSLSEVIDLVPEETVNGEAIGGLLVDSASPRITPILSIQDIFSDEKGAVTNVDAVSSRILNSTMFECEKCMQDFNSAYVSLRNNIRNLVSFYKTAKEGISTKCVPQVLKLDAAVRDLYAAGKDFYSSYDSIIGRLKHDSDATRDVLRLYALVHEQNDERTAMRREMAKTEDKHFEVSKMCNVVCGLMPIVNEAVKRTSANDTEVEIIRVCASASAILSHLAKITDELAMLTKYSKLV